MGKQVWGSLWKKYAAVSSKDMLNEPSGITQRSEFVGLLLQHFDLKGKRILDVGTGTGQFAIELALRGAVVTGIDIDKDSIELATKLAKDYNIDCDFIHCDLFDISKVYGFDIVFSMGTLEHFTDIEMTAMLKHMSELGDYVITGVPYNDSKPYMMSKKHSQRMGTWEYGEEKDFKSINHLISAAGLKPLHESSIGLVSEAMYLKRMNNKLIPMQIAKGLKNMFDDKPVGNWLINIASKNFDSFARYDPREGVSIIIPAYNIEKHVEQLINNLEAIKYSGDLDIIIINDCSTDKTKKLLYKRTDDIIIINLDKNVGEIAAREVGLKRAIYNNIFFLDADDIMPPYAIECLMTDLRNLPGKTHLSVSCAMIQNGEFTGEIWFHPWLKEVKDYISDELHHLCGKISLTNTILNKDVLLRVYKIYHQMIKKVKIDRMNVAGDSFLVDIMVFTGEIQRILPVYYTYCGYYRNISTASQQMINRVRDIPLQVAYCLNQAKDNPKLNEKINNRAMELYKNKFGEIFVTNLKQYRKKIK